MSIWPTHPQKYNCMLCNMRIRLELLLIQQSHNCFPYLEGEVWFTDTWYTIRYYPRSAQQDKTGWDEITRHVKSGIIRWNWNDPLVSWFILSIFNNNNYNCHDPKCISIEDDSSNPATQLARPADNLKIWQKTQTKASKTSSSHNCIFSTLIPFLVG